MALEIPSGSITIMHVNTAPPGWVKTNTFNEHMLRVVTGSVGSGGTVDFSSFAVSHSTTITGSSRTLFPVTLTSGELPSHSHRYYNGVNFSKANTTPPLLNPVMRDNNSLTTSLSVGSSVAHGHPGFDDNTVTFSPDGDLDMRVKYVDVLLVERV